MSRSHPRIAKRAAELLDHPELQGDTAQAYSTRELASMLDVSPQFLEICRGNGSGPRFVRLAPTVIRYRQSDVRAWLESLTSHRSTAEYEHRSVAGPGRGRKAVPA